MYYTEEEPPIDLIGKKRHFFGKPSLKGITGNTAVRSNYNDSGQDGQPNKVETLLKNQETLDSLRKIYSSDRDIKSQLENQFRSLDQNQ